MRMRWRRRDFLVLYSSCYRMRTAPAMSFAWRRTNSSCMMFSSLLPTQTEWISIARQLDGCFSMFTSNSSHAGRRDRFLWFLVSFFYFCLRLFSWQSMRTQMSNSPVECYTDQFNECLQVMIICNQPHRIINACVRFSCRSFYIGQFFICSNLSIDIGRMTASRSL